MLLFTLTRFYLVLTLCNVWYWRETRIFPRVDVGRQCCCTAWGCAVFPAPHWGLCVCWEGLGGTSVHVFTRHRVSYCFLGWGLFFFSLSPFLTGMIYKQDNIFRVEGLATLLYIISELEDQTSCIQEIFHVQKYFKICKDKLPRLPVLSWKKKSSNVTINCNWQWVSCFSSANCENSLVMPLMIIMKTPFKSQLHPK